MSEESHHLVELITRLLRPEEIAIVNAISKGKWMADDLVRLKVVDIDNGGMGGAASSMASAINNDSVPKLEEHPM